jgi:hypothetical protein
MRRCLVICQITLQNIVNKNISKYKLALNKRRYSRVDGYNVFGQTK